MDIFGEETRKRTENWKLTNTQCNCGKWDKVAYSLFQRKVAATIGQQQQTNITRDKVVISNSKYRQDERIPQTTRQEYIELRFGFTFQACHSTQFIQLILDVLGYTSEVFYRPCIVRVGDRFSSESEVSYCPCIVCVGDRFSSASDHDWFSVH